MHTETPADPLHGVMAEYDSGQALVDAARQTVAQGFTRVEAYSPVPIEELNDIIHKKRTILPKLVLAGGLTGMATGFALQYWASVIEYPMNVGGRPQASWTTFIVPSYELTILFAALTAAIGMIVLSGLPQPYHPVFNVERFSMASSDKFFLVIEAKDPKFEQPAAGDFLRSTGAKGSTTLRKNLTLALLAATALAGCRQDMHDAPRYEAFEASSTFADNRASRTPPVGTVARGWLREDDALYTGKVAGQLIDQFPFAIGHADLARGRQRFNIYCTPCHGTLGDGNGMVVQRGLRQAASFHQDRLRQEKVGYVFDVITNGFGAMSDYAAQIPVRDRWLIVAYVRTLQLSQHAAVADLPADQRAALEAGTTEKPAEKH